jgi:hypothetical protein
VPEASGTQDGTAVSPGERTRSNLNLLWAPRAGAGRTNPTSATPQSTAILAGDEVQFVWMLFFMSSPPFCRPFWRIGLLRALCRLTDAFTANSMRPTRQSAVELNQIEVGRTPRSGIHAKVRISEAVGFSLH